MRDICLECVNYLTPVAGNVEWLSEVSALEQRIDDMTSDYRRSHLERMRGGSAPTTGALSTPSCSLTLSVSATMS